MLAYGHYGRPLCSCSPRSRATARLRGPRDDRRDRAADRRGPPEGLLHRQLRQHRAWSDETSRSRSAPAATAPTRTWIVDHVVPWIRDDCGGAREIVVTGCSFGAYHAANFALKRADLFPLAICQSGVYDVSRVGWGERGDAVYFNNPMDYVRTCEGDHLDWLRGAGQHPARLRAGPVGGHDRRARRARSVRRVAGREGDTARARPLGARRPARLAVVARPARPPPAAVLLGVGRWRTPPDRAAAGHGGGLAVRVRGRSCGGAHRRSRTQGEHARLATERIIIEPFDLRARPRYSLVIDRLALWYYVRASG